MKPRPRKATFKKRNALLQKKRKLVPLKARLLFEEYKNFAYMLVNKTWAINKDIFKIAGMSYKDLEQEAMAELHKAAMAYDPKRGFKFTTLAGKYIKTSFNNLIRSLMAEKRKAILKPIIKDPKTRSHEKKESHTHFSETKNKMMGEIMKLNATSRNKNILIDTLGLITGEAKS